MNSFCKLMIKRILVFSIMVSMLMAPLNVAYARQSEVTWLVSSIDNLNFGTVYSRKVADTKRYVTISNQDTKAHTMTAAILDTDRVWVAEIPSCFEIGAGESISFAVSPYKANREGLYHGAILIKEMETEDTGNTVVINCSVYVTESSSYVRNVSVYPNMQIMAPESSCQFAADVIGEQISDTGVIWSVEGNTSENTAITAEGLLTLGADENADGLIIMAKSKANEAVYGGAVIKVEKTGKLTVSLTANPATAGIVAGQGAYDMGSVAKLTAAPASGNTFEGWYDGDNKISDSLVYELEVNENRCITARFSGVNVIRCDYSEPVPELGKVEMKEETPTVVEGADSVKYSISATKANGYGSIYPSGKINVLEGNDKIYVMAPGRENVVDQIIVDGSDVGNRALYGFDNVIENHSISVSFRKRTEDAIIRRAMLNYQLGIALEGENESIYDELLTYIDGSLRDKGIGIKAARELIAAGNDDMLLAQAYLRGDMDLSMLSEYSETNTSVSGYDAGIGIPADFECKVLSEAERLAVYSGTRGMISIIIDRTADEEKLEEIHSNASAKNVCDVFEATVLKSVGGSGSYVSELQEPMTVTIKLPEEIYKEETEYYIAKLQDGKTEKVENQSQEGNFISFEMAIGGEYVICEGKVPEKAEPQDFTAQGDKVSSTNGKKRPQMPDWYGRVSPGNGVVTDDNVKPNTTMFVYIMFVVILLPFVCYVFKRNKYDTEDLEEDDFEDEPEESESSGKKKFGIQYIKANIIKFIEKTKHKFKKKGGKKHEED